MCFYTDKNIIFRMNDFFNSIKTSSRVFLIELDKYLFIRVIYVDYNYYKILI